MRWHVVINIKICTYLQLFTFMGILLDITIYSVIHYNPLHITQFANHPKCSIVYTNHPVYTYIH